MNPNAAQVHWWNTLIATGLGVAIVIIQPVFFNDPGAVDVKQVI